MRLYLFCDEGRAALLDCIQAQESDDDEFRAWLEATRFVLVPRWVRVVCK